MDIARWQAAVLSPRVLRPARWVLFLGIVLYGVLHAAQASIATDETIMNAFAGDIYAYVTGDGAWPESLERRFLGPFVEFSIFLVSMRIFIAWHWLTGELLSIADMAVLRHVITYGFFVLGVGAFFFVARRIFRSANIAFAGAVMLATSPRIIGDAFTNSRDIPHMALFLLGILTLLRLLERPTPGRAITHAFVCAMDIATRSMGVFLPVLTFLFLGLRPTKRSIVGGLLYIVAIIPLVILFWPLLWTNPLGHFLDTLRFASSFGGGGWYFGSESGHVWHYPLVWIGITTPLLYTLLFLTGLVSIARKWLRKAIYKEEVLMVLWFAVPLLQVIFRSGIYNGWRHLYFIYPAFLLIALYGLRWLWDRAPRMRTALAAVLILYTGYFGIRNAVYFPLSYMFFVPSASAIQGNFELDYWGLSSREALEMILREDDRQNIGLRVSNNITLENARTFYPGRFLASETPDYAIDMTSDQAFGKEYPFAATFDVIDAGGIRVATIYKLR